MSADTCEYTPAVGLDDCDGEAFRAILSDRLYPRERSPLAILRRVAEQWAYAPGPGTMGGREDYKRSNRPRPGDFVVVLLGCHPAAFSMGWLLEAGEYGPLGTTSARIETLAGTIMDWSNARIVAVPVGSPFDHNDDAGRWQWPTRPEVKRG